MKLVVIGAGQCGCRIADEFVRLNRKARSERHIEIVTDAFAVNTDLTDLSGLSWIKSDYRHRIIIGNQKTYGHGVGKVNEVGAEVAKDDGDKIIESIQRTRRLYDSDAFLVIAGAAGGTGSGALPVITQLIKERYFDKPVYDLVILPFEHEETTEERSIYNSATCLKSANSVADAIIMVDNQRYIKKDTSLKTNLKQINEMIAEPFYDILCAGEETNPKYVGGKTLDAGDIMQTLKGWTVIGYGNSEIPMFNLPALRSPDFKKKSTETEKGIEAMDEAIAELSLRCNPADARRALYLLSSPAKEMNMQLIKDLGVHIRNLCPKATIRYGDYPREQSAVEVTVVLSELKDVEKLREYYTKSIELMSELKSRQKETDVTLKAINDKSKDLPGLV